MAIGVKSKKKISKSDTKSLKIIKEESKFRNLFIVSRDEISASFDGIKSLHWEQFLKKLWSHQISLD